MGTEFAEERWELLANSEENRGEKAEDEDEGDIEEEEALSLCDLPINEEESNERKSRIQCGIEIQDDFDFRPSLSKDSEMCAADEVFFQGQILPFRLSVSSENGFQRFTSRCESMDHYSSGGFTTTSSSRSSSIRSHNSSSSGSSSTLTPPKYKPRPRNQFHSHPSPTPQMKSSTIKQRNPNNSHRKSSMWSIFRVGLVTPPEIALQDLKIRSQGIQNSGSRNSTSSSISNGSIKKAQKDRKKKQKFSDKNGGLFGGCKCSVNAVETMPSRVVVIRRNAHENAIEIDEKVQETSKKKVHQQAGKQALSRHRTFEWLKQLSLEGTADEAA